MSEDWKTWVDGLSSDSEEIVDTSRDSLVRHAPPEALPRLRRLLAQTESANVRNTVALILSELKDSESVPILVRLLRDPRTERHRGTLGWALAPFDYLEHVELLVDLLIVDAWEASQMAFMLLEDGEGKVSGDVWEACQERLRSALEGAAPDRASVIAAALEMFDDTNLTQ